MSKEADYDIANMSSIASGYLFSRVELAKASAVMAVINAAAPTFDPTTWVSGNITNPNLKDVIIALMNQVVNSENWADDIQYVPNIALVNWSDFLGLAVTKDKDEAYVFAEDFRNTYGVQIIPCHKNDMPAGSILIGDFSQCEVYDYEPYNVLLGHINEQLIYNLFTMVGETRFVKLVREYSKNAFCKGTIATIKTALAGS
jgi:hypothetical protein